MLFFECFGFFAKQILSIAVTKSVHGSVCICPVMNWWPDWGASSLSARRNTSSMTQMRQKCSSSVSRLVRLGEKRRWLLRSAAGGGQTEHINQCNVM